MKLHRIVALLATVCLGLAACSDATSSGSEAQSSTEPVSGGQLTHLVGSEPRSLDPNIDTPRQVEVISSNILERLIKKDYKTNAMEKDGLVTDWRQPSPKTWAFTIREGVEFHNGEPFDASAAAFSVEVARAETSSLSGSFSPITGAQATDATTLEVTTAFPTAIVPALLSEVFAVPPAAYGDDPEAFAKAPAGTGPFKFDSWTAGESITLVRNDSYWGDKAYLDRLVFRWAADPASRLAQVESGGADLAGELPPALLEQAGNNPNVTTSSEAGLRTAFLGFNAKEAPLDDVRLRKAVAYSIDREAITEGLFGGLVRIQPQAFDPSLGIPEGKVYPYDPEMAKQLVAEVGEIPAIQLNYPIGRLLLMDQVGPAIGGMLEAAGFKIKLNPMEAGAFISLLYSNEMPGIFITGIDQRFPDPDSSMGILWTTDALLNTCSDEKTDQMRRQGLQTLDPSARTEIYTEFQEYIQYVNVCYVGLYNQNDSYVMSNRVHGFESPYDELIDFKAIWVTD